MNEEVRKENGRTKKWKTIENGELTEQTNSGLCFIKYLLGATDQSCLYLL